jgi:hypothetical protein
VMSLRKPRTATRLRHLVLATLAALAVASAVPGAASAAPGWLDGVSRSQSFPNCSGTTGNVISYTGYWGDTDGTYPRTGDRYWGHIVVGISGNPCSGSEFAATDIAHPAATGFDFGTDAWGRVRCFYTSPNTGQTTEETNNPNVDCRQNPGAGFSGSGWNLGGRTIPSFGIFEVIFPVKTTQALGGSSTNHKMVAPITTAISSPLTATPEQWVWVFPSQSGGGSGGSGGGSGGSGGGSAGSGITSGPAGTAPAGPQPATKKKKCKKKKAKAGAAKKGCKKKKKRR